VNLKATNKFAKLLIYPSKNFQALSKDTLINLSKTL